MSNDKMSIKQAVSVSEMAQMLQLSRARFYQLLESGFFAKPKIDERSKRPYYDAALQEKLLEARQSGLGADGSVLMFYSPRKKGAKTRIKKVDPVIREIIKTLKVLGIDATVEQIQQALSELYPEGTENKDQGLVIRELYKKLKQTK